MKPKGLQFDKKVENKNYPSQYGSHAKMLTEMKTNDPTFVVCKDDDGNYITEKSHLDNGLADPYRYAANRAKLLEKFTAV